MINLRVYDDGMMILYIQGVQGKFFDEMFLEWSSIEPVTYRFGYMGPWDLFLANSCFMGKNEAFDNLILWNAFFFNVPQ